MIKNELEIVTLRAGGSANTVGCEGQRLFERWSFDHNSAKDFPAQALLVTDQRDLV